jgi:hypothetical protein
MLRELEYMTGIFVRAPAEFFSVVHDPIATMLLVNGHCEQSHTIPIMFNQKGSNGFIAAADDPVRLLTDEGGIEARHERTQRGRGAKYRNCRFIDDNGAPNPTSKT